MQEKGHILHNWNKVIRPLRLGGFGRYLLGEAVFHLVDGSTQSLLCEKQQNDSVNIHFIALLFKKRKLSCTNPRFSLSSVVLVELIVILFFFYIYLLNVVQSRTSFC